MTSPTHHAAVILPSRKATFVVENRPTPAPGANEVLIEVKAIALNPIDFLQRTQGFPPIRYPAIIGSDIAGTVLAVGPGVPTGELGPGTRVVAFAPSFFAKGAPNYGAFQERALVPCENVAPLPDATGLAEASVIPMALQTAWCGWMQIGIARDTKHVAEDKKAVLVWGAGGSVGCAAVQIAKTLGFTVYATASAKNHAYLTRLGAHRVFDYRDENVTASLVEAVKKDGVTLDKALLASGDLTPCIDVLQAFERNGSADIALAPFKLAMFWWKIFPNWRKTSVRFIAAPAPEKDRRDFFHFVFRVYLRDKLRSGEFVPSPTLYKVSGGLGAIEQAVHAFKKGVSAVKMVIEI